MAILNPVNNINHHKKNQCMYWGSLLDWLIQLEDTENP